MSHLSRTSSSISVATTTCDTESTGYEVRLAARLAMLVCVENSILSRVLAEPVGPHQVHTVAASGGRLKRAGNGGCRLFASLHSLPGPRALTSRGPSKRRRLRRAGERINNA